MSVAAPDDRRPSRRARGGARLKVAWAAGRAASAVSRRTGLGSGGVIGGRVLLALVPGAARALADGRRVYLVSGTNGKTTTTALLTAAMRAATPTDTNADGANTAPGIAQALAGGTAGTAVLETDEGWLPWTIDQTRPSVVVLLNLSRDQLHRHHEVGRVTARWREALQGVDTVVANAEDPDIVYAANAARHQVWVAAGQRWIQDDLVCPQCGQHCQHDDQGWHCVCGLRRPEPDWWVEGDDLVSHDTRVALRLGLPGDVNRINAALSAAAAGLGGVPPEDAVRAMQQITTVAGRYAVHDHNGHQARLMLAKNPAGWVETIHLVAQEDRPLVLGFNSEGVDGRDPSWLYDVHFEELAGRRIIVVGRRATDLLVRLTMDGLTTVERAGSVVAALDALPPGPVDVIANYSAFQDARRELDRGPRH